MSAAAPFALLDPAAPDFRRLDVDVLAAQLEEESAAILPLRLGAAACAAIASLYDDPSVPFRATVRMARHGFGRGEYRYFDRPLPAPVQALREALYPPLARIANDWARRLARGAPSTPWPDTLDGLRARCAAAGQHRPTPLLLRYGPGDHNCLHQDVYGAVHFPLQAIVLLDAPGVDFDGGELVLVEQRPRRQSRATVVPLTQGGIAIVPVRERPRDGAHGVHRTQLRHGVSTVRRGLRRTLGLIFHDAT